MEVDEKDELITPDEETETTPDETTDGIENEGDEGSEEVEPEGSEVQTEVEPEIEEEPEAPKRINDLMSKWQKAEAAREKAEAELAELKNSNNSEPQTFGEDFVPDSYDSLYEKFKERMTAEQAQEATRAEMARQADRARLNTWIEGVEAKDEHFNRDAFFKFVGKVMEKGVVINTNNLDGAYEIYNMNRQSEKKGQEKVQNARARTNSVASPSQKPAPIPGEVDASILKSRKTPFELALEELKKRK